MPEALDVPLVVEKAQIARPASIQRRNVRDLQRRVDAVGQRGLDPRGQIAERQRTGIVEETGIGHRPITAAEEATHAGQTFVQQPNNLVGDVHGRVGKDHHGIGQFPVQDQFVAAFLGQGRMIVRSSSLICWRPNR